jgi:hypothetical protein
MMAKPGPTALLLLLLAGTGARADGPAAVERSLIAADAARVQAMLAADVPELERGLADTLSYGHSSGQVQGRQELIDEMRSGVRKYRALTTEDVVARAYGCAGVVTAKAHADVEFRGQPLSFNMRYTATYSRQHGRWLLVAYQSVKLP